MIPKVEPWAHIKIFSGPGKFDLLCLGLGAQIPMIFQVAEDLAPCKITKRIFVTALEIEENLHGQEWYRIAGYERYSESSGAVEKYVLRYVVSGPAIGSVRGYMKRVV